MLLLPVSCIQVIHVCMYTDICTKLKDTNYIIQSGINHQPNPLTMTALFRKLAHVVNSIKQSPVLKGHLFLVLS